MQKILIIPVLILIMVLLTAGCAPAPIIDVSFDPADLKFSGERAYQIEEEFVTTYINRHSDTEQSREATEWLRQQFESYGWTCEFDNWEVINYSKPVQLRNVVCRLPGINADDPREILVLAHHDQAPTTIQGADNDGSGIAILLHMAEIFAEEGALKYTLVFVADDAEEYGMIGSRRYIQTHPNDENIIGGLSLDNLGRPYYDSIILESVGQFSRYGPIWIAIATKEAAQTGGADWPVKIKGPVDQILDQALPLSMTDQGPMIAAGVPALGFGGGYPWDAKIPPEWIPPGSNLSSELPIGELTIRDFHFHLWHHPDDTMEYQSPEALGQSGLISEIWVRQLLSMDEFPQESGPYLYLEDTDQALRGLPLYIIFIVFVGLFFTGSYFSGERTLKSKGQAWLGALPHFLGLWLPLVASVLLLYLFVEVGLMDEWYLYPATTKDPAMLNPRWPAVILFLIGTAILLYLGRWLARRFVGDSITQEWKDIRSLTFLVIGLVGIYIIFANPFSLLFLVPVLFWFLIRGRKGAGRLLDILFFILGGLLLYAVIYIFGWEILRSGWVFLWMFMNIISCGMFSFPAMLAGTAVLAAGLSMIVNPPKKPVKAKET